MALAILFIGLMKTYNSEVYGYLFGSILSVTREELLFGGVLVAIVVGLRRWDAAMGVVTPPV